VGLDDQALEPLGTGRQGERTTGQREIGGSHPIQLAQAQDLLGPEPSDTPACLSDELAELFPPIGTIG